MKLKVSYVELVNGEGVMKEMVVEPKVSLDCACPMQFWYVENGRTKKMKAEYVVSIEAIEG